MGGLVAELNKQIVVDLNALQSKEEYKIAVLLPTRKRGKLAERCLLSLAEKAHNNEDIIYMVALDDDDQESIDYFESTVLPKFDELDLHYEVKIVPRWGYINLHEYVNYLGREASADWLMFWNDDAIMDTNGWDEKIIEQTGKFRVLRMQENQQHPYAIFPIVPKDWHYLLGHLSSHQMSDAQISQIAYMCDIMVNIDVHCTHDRFDLTGNNDDVTYNNRPQLEGNAKNPGDLNSPQTSALRYSECCKIMWYLNKIGQGNDHFLLAITQKGLMWDKLRENDPLGCTTQFTPDKKTGKYIKGQE